MKHSNSKGNLTLITMAAWLCILGTFCYWQEMDTRQQEKKLAMSTANTFFQQNLIARQWNAGHGGVYVPVTPESPPNPFLSEHLRDLTTDNGMKLTKINPAYMTRQMAELAARNGADMRFHITSLKPVNPANKAADWEEKWLQSFEQGDKEQGNFYFDSKTSWFRYMAPLTVTKDCLQCHEMQGYKEGDIRGGISVSLPYPAHTHLHLFVSYGSASVVGLIFIFIFGTYYARRQRLFDATFNSPIPTCVTDQNHTILMANKSYWKEFGEIPKDQKTIKCYEHRPGKSCHTDHCPLTQILNGSDEYICEPHKEGIGVSKHFIVTAKPLCDSKGTAIGVVESFQEITERKRLEEEKEHLISELKKSLAQVKLLSGFIPICASCKKIRDDQGFWNQIEAYISQHSDAKFSHGICPDCVRKLYPEVADEILATVNTKISEDKAQT